MIRCLPRGICSWNFDLEGEGHTGRVEFDWVSEQGKIVADGVRYDVCKHGLFSGRWTLEQGGETVAGAQKQSAFARTFHIATRDGDLELRADSLFNRSFTLVRPGGRGVAAIETDHLFTRRATIESAPSTDFVTLCFAFWLAALMWRRAASNNS